MVRKFTEAFLNAKVYHLHVCTRRRLCNNSGKPGHLLDTCWRRVILYIQNQFHIIAIRLGTNMGMNQRICKLPYSLSADHLSVSATCLASLNDAPTGLLKPSCRILGKQAFCFYTIQETTNSICWCSLIAFPY